MSSLWNQVKLYKPPMDRWLAGAGVCFICRATGATSGGLCEGCRNDLPWRRNPRLKRRIDSLDAAFATFRYESPITEVVKAAKFHGELGALSVLAAGFHESFLRELEEIDVLVPVPLLPWRFLRRGYNQAGELGAALCKLTGYPIRHDLLARRQTWGVAQSRLGAVARRLNVREAFEVKGPLHGKRVAIVDDVITTGATCAALAIALRNAGAIKVVAIAAAATPLRRADSAD